MSEASGEAMRRRDFIKVIGGAAATWPVAVRSQQGERMRRIGVLMFSAKEDPQSMLKLGAFVEQLQRLNWTKDNNAQIDIRWDAADTARSRSYVAELLALAPDIIVSHGSPATAALQEATRTLPIVFVNVTDPVGAGYVASLARPGGNATGFSYVEYGMSGKWLELLKEIAPRVTRAAVLRDPSHALGTGQLGAIQSVAPSLRIEITPMDVRDAGEIERTITDFARAPNGGLIVSAAAGAANHRKLIITLAAQHKLPTVYFQSSFVEDGGLISYGPDPVDGFRKAALYVDRILKGERPADLPVQAPTKYELAINLKTAKALDLPVPSSLIGRADEVIE